MGNFNYICGTLYRSHGNLINRVDTAEERISELLIGQSKLLKGKPREKKSGKKEHSIKKMWNNIKSSNMYNLRPKKKR